MEDGILTGAKLRPVTYGVNVSRMANLSKPELERTILAADGDTDEILRG
jgi:hypothetical protein